MGVFDCVDSSFRHIDQLGVPVTFSYRKHNTFNTCLGGVLSLLGMILIAGYVFGEVWQVIT